MQITESKKILILFGTRPEAIKLAPIILKAADYGFQVKTCATGQHKEMLDQVLKLFSIVPDYDLQVMRPNQELSSLTARILDGVSDVLRRFSPDIVLVQGDTTTAFASALAAFYSKIPVGHIEAGLRTYNLRSPFPEEAMRQMISRIASWHFAPTEGNAQNLIDEGISHDSVFVTGNTVIDALLHIVKLVRSGSNPEFLELASPIVKELSTRRRMVLITGHRRENFGGALARICGAIREIANKFPDTLFLYPVHMNPNVLGPVKEILGPVRNIELMKPVNYYTFVYLMDRAHLIISDSGGVQEEGPSLGRPVFVTREDTERMEVVETGAVKLVGTNADVIVGNVSAALEDESFYNRMLIGANPYGDGHSAQRILDLLHVKE
jgi:UDP-N-acetylglucosamine 2-epimerase (non-hydrolysing)